MRRVLIVAMAVALAATAFSPPPTAHPPTASSPRTIVVLEDGVDDVAAAAVRLLSPRGLQPSHVYRHAVRGFAVDAAVSEVADLTERPEVAYVEADRPVRAAGQRVPTGIRRIDAVAAAGIGSGRLVPEDIAIIDTGIGSHPDLRVAQRFDCTDSTVEPTLEWVDHAVFGTCKEGGTDTDGHGTHVAGIAAARDNGRGVVGVAPGARLWSIRVLRSTEGGSLSDLVAGIDEVTRHAEAIEVANISLVARGRSATIDDAIAAATDAGVVVVVAAGNASANASGFTPANSPDAITVSAVTDLDGRPRARAAGTCHGRDDRFASYSNHGAVVDIAAPGSCIRSTAISSGTVRRSGTSMAAPHVAGAAALRIHQRGFARRADRADRVLSFLLATSAREHTACGYVGSPSNERLLDLRAGC